MSVVRTALLCVGFCNVPFASVFFWLAFLWGAGQIKLMQMAHYRNPHTVTLFKPPTSTENPHLEDSEKSALNFFLRPNLLYFKEWDYIMRLQCWNCAATVGHHCIGNNEKPSLQKCASQINRCAFMLGQHFQRQTRYQKKIGYEGALGSCTLKRNSIWLP